MTQTRHADRATKLFSQSHNQSTQGFMKKGQNKTGQCFLESFLTEATRQKTHGHRTFISLSKFVYLGKLIQHQFWRQIKSSLYGATNNLDLFIQL